MKTLAVKASAVLLAAAALSAVSVGAASAATPGTSCPGYAAVQVQPPQASVTFHVYNQTNQGNQLQVVNLSGPDWAGHPPVGANLRNGDSWDFGVNNGATNTDPSTLELGVVDVHGNPIPGQPGATLAFHVDQWGNPSVRVTDARVGVIPTVHGTNIYIGQSGGA